MITSSSNPKIKNIIALQKKPKERREQGLFVVEGKKLVGEIPAGWISEIYVSESYYKSECGTADGAVQPSGFEVLSDDLFGKVSDTRTPQGILALVRMPSYTFEDLLGAASAETAANSTGESAEAVINSARISVAAMENAGKNSPLLLILEDIQDPGNLGTILRTAEGAGVTGVLMSRGTADIYNPKVVRSTMGSIYRVPFLVAEEWPETIRKLRAAGVKLYAAHLQGASDYDAFDYCGGSGFMIGNEANGLSDEAASLADASVRIPMCGRVESLNAAVSASLLAYEAMRQRRHMKRSFA